ncbi:MAG: hypothetical protein N3G21_04470 [Candidatus Hydrogenedentes bacterium]|nr:hypothetical protein [Candidatus Hydrogenedentota bacterium]
MERSDKVTLLVLYSIVLIGFGIYYYSFTILSEYHKIKDPQNYLYRIKRNLDSGRYEVAEKEIREVIQTFRPPEPEVFELLHRVTKYTKGGGNEERLELRKEIYRLLDTCGSAEMGKDKFILDSIRGKLKSSYNLDKNQIQIVRSVWKNLIANPWKCFAEFGISESEILDLLILSGGEICFGSNIGNTGVSFDGDILVLSEGSSDGSGAQIWYQGRNYGGSRRGFYVVIMTLSPHRVIRSDRFDVWESKNEAIRMAQFLDEIPERHIGIFAVSDEASENMTPTLEESLIKFGFARRTYEGWDKKFFGYSYAFAGIGVKGASEGSAIQNWAKYEPGKRKIPVAIVGILKGVVER